MLAKEYLKCRMEQYVLSPLSRSRSFLGGDGGNEGGGEEALADGADSNLMAPDELRNLGRWDLGWLGAVWMVFDVF